MPPSAGVTNARADRTSLNSDRKRKRLHRDEIEGQLTQQTLQSTFTSQQKPHSACIVSSPDSKRSKPENPVPAHRTPHTVKDMYTFTSRSPAATNGVIDLTSTSPSPVNRIKALGEPMKTATNKVGVNSNVGARKLVVKNLKSNTSWDSKAYLEKVWKQLEDALNLIWSDAKGGYSKEDLYRGAENVCRQGGAPTLFSRLENSCKTHLEQNVVSKLLHAAANDNIAVLKLVLSEWERWTQQVTTIRAIFFFLDRSYLLNSSKPTLDELSRQLFRQFVFNNSTLRAKIIDGTCDLIMLDRTLAKSMDQQLYRSSISMLHELSTYTANFEPHFLGLSQKYISEWSSSMIKDKSIDEFVGLADTFIASEMHRCDEFDMDSSTRRELLTLLEEHLVQRTANDLTKYESCRKLLENNAFEDLSALYRLLERRRLGDQLRPTFEKWIDETGSNIVLANNTDDMIIHLLSLKQRLDRIWREAFQRNESLGHGLRESFETFMNRTKKGDATWGTDNTKVGEMIAKYVDQLLRGGAKAIPDVLASRKSSIVPNPATDKPPADAADDDENEIDEDAEINVQLDQVLDLFRFVHGKAVFEAFYKKDLARRLLMGRSASADAERSMLARLNTECGSGFTQNLEQMFKDVELAREEMQSYKQRLEDLAGVKKGKGMELSVNILSAAAWPTYPDIPVIVPTNIKRLINDFGLYYKSKHSGRKLDWKHALAHCQMRATFNKASKELVVSSFQAIVLLLFNKLAPGESLSYNHILTESGLPEVEVKRTLQSLACAKLRPLTKEPRGKEINDTDTFHVNLQFEHPKYRVKINQVQLKETKEENKETHMRVAEDRNFECQAAIVRIMKSHKTVSHSELVSEVIKATISRGVLGVADIKKNIDRLIEKDYMEREEGNMYSYIA